MPMIQLQNGAASTTSVNARTATDVTLTPTSLAGFPGTPFFTLYVRETGELLLVTAVNIGTPNTWTVTRGYGGSAAMPIVAGNHFDYSVTREMLLGGFVAKLDEQNFAADTANGVLTLTVPAGLAFLRNLRVRMQISATTDGYTQFRFNADASAFYYNTYAYWGAGSSSGQWNGLTCGRCWSGNSGALPGVATDTDLRIGSADSTDRWKTWTMHQWMRSNSGQQYSMLLSGAWQPAVQAAISTIQVSVDTSGNGTWAAGTMRAGSRAILYGEP